jgi:hypothetical protein
MHFRLHIRPSGAAGDLVLQNAVFGRRTTPQPPAELSKLVYIHPPGRFLNWQNIRCCMCVCVCATKLRPINLQNGFVFQQLPPLMCFVWRRKQISGQLCDFF